MDTLAPIEIFTEFLESVRLDLLSDLDVNNRNATGKTRASIIAKDITDSGGKLVGPEHVFYTFFGRGPGKMPPLYNIVEWCNARGIPRNRAYAIAKSIKENGTKLYRQGASKDNALIRTTSPERLNELTQSLIKSFVERLKFTINENILAPAA